MRMDREFIRLPEFEKHCKRIGLTEEDVKSIESELLFNPLLGDVMEGTGGLRKFRFALPNAGKSGGTRVIYIDFAFYEKIYLIAVFAKSDVGNLSKAERNELRGLVNLLESELRRKRLS